MLFDLLNTVFCRTPAIGNDPDGSGEPASLPPNEGNQGQGGALNSDVVQISKKEYQDLLSQKGLLSAVHSRADRERDLYEKQIATYERQLSKPEAAQLQASALEQLLEKASNNDDDNLFGDNNTGFMKQAFQALQSDINTQLSGFQNEVQRLNEELQNTKNESLNASRTTRRKANIDSAMNEKIMRLMNDYNITRDEAIDYSIMEEDALAKYVQTQSADDNVIGQSYVDETLGAVRALGQKLNEFDTHKKTVERTKQERERKLNALIDGDTKPDRVIVDINKTEQIKDYGWPQPMKGESQSDFLYRMARVETDKLQAQRKNNNPAPTGFK